MSKIDAYQLIRQQNDPEHQKALREAYEQIPEIVLLDLQNFIHPNELSFVVNDEHGRLSAYNEGLRSVWLHIQKRREAPPSLAPVIEED